MKKVHLIPNGSHDTILATSVWHACVPSSQVPNKNVALLTHYLYWRTHAPPVLIHLWPDITMEFTRHLTTGPFFLCGRDLVGRRRVSV